MKKKIVEYDGNPDEVIMVLSKKKWYQGDVWYMYLPN